MSIPTDVGSTAGEATGAVPGPERPRATATPASGGPALRAGLVSAGRSTALRLLTPLYRRAGSAYLAGPQRSQAVAIAERLLVEGHDVTLGYWPEKAESAGALAAEYLATVEAMTGQGGRVGVAVKAPALGFDRTLVRRLARRAAEADVRLLFDSHSPGDAEQTLALAREARTEGAATGVALPGRWARSSSDAAAVAEAALTVRLIKGQWPDDGDGGPSGEAALRAAYLRVLDRLIEHRVPVSVATHDAVLMARALARPVAAGGRAAEVPGAELLLGLPVRRALGAAVRGGARVGFYVPFGHPGLPYPFMAVLRRPRLTAMLAQGIALGARNQRRQQRAVLAGRSA